MAIATCPAMAATERGPPKNPHACSHVPRGISLPAGCRTTWAITEQHRNRSDSAPGPISQDRAAHMIATTARTTTGLSGMFPWVRSRQETHTKVSTVPITSAHHEALGRIVDGNTGRNLACEGRPHPVGGRVSPPFGPMRPGWPSITTLPFLR